MVALKFDVVTLEGASDSAALLELFADRFQFVRMLRNTRHHRHGFATAALGLAANSDHAITGGRRPIFTTDAVRNSTLALGAKAPRVSAVNRSRWLPGTQIGAPVGLMAPYTSTRVAVGEAAQ